MPSYVIMQSLGKIGETIEATLCVPDVTGFPDRRTGVSVQVRLVSEQTVCVDDAPRGIIWSVVPLRKRASPMPLGHNYDSACPHIFFSLTKGVARRRTASTKYSPVAAGEADDQEAPQLRGGTFAESHGCHRRFARMRSSALLCEPASAARRRHRAHVARDRDPRPQSAMARRRGHHACGGA